MRFFKKEPDFKFMNKRIVAFILSGVIIAAGIATFLTKGFNLGIEFTGGTLVEVGFKNQVAIAEVKNALEQADFANISVQKVGESGESTYMIKAVGSKKGENEDEAFNLSKTGEDIKNVLVNTFGDKAEGQLKNDLNLMTEKELEVLFKADGVSDVRALETAKMISEIPLIFSMADLEAYKDENGKSIDTDIIEILKKNTSLAEKFDVNQLSKTDLASLISKYWAGSTETSDAAVENVVTEIGKDVIIEAAVDALSKTRIISDFQKTGSEIKVVLKDVFGSRIRALLKEGESLDQLVGALVDQKIVSVLSEHTVMGNMKILKEKAIGAQVGYDLRKKTTLATIWALLGMLVYVAFRFKLVFGFSALITLAHDVLISLSVILFFNVEMSLSVVAALLTIIGYSLNDTIVIFDRVRDNIKPLKREGADVLLNKSINQTLSRTIVTSGTTLITVLSLFFFGGDVIHAFSFTLIVGVLVGTYSSIFQSCAWLRIWEKYLLETKKKKI